MFPPQSFPLPETIDDVLTDHNKANHDSLLIDADTLDTKHFSDVQTDAQAKVDTHATLTATHGVSDAIVGSSDAQTLTNKTLGAGSTVIGADDVGNAANQVPVLDSGGRLSREQYPISFFSNELLNMDSFNSGNYTFGKRKITLRTGVTSYSYAGVYVARYDLVATTDYAIISLVGKNTIGTITPHAGLVFGLNPDVSEPSLAVRNSATANKYELTSYDGTTASAIDTTDTFDLSAEHEFTLVIRAGTVDLYVDNVLEVTKSTNMPSTAKGVRADCVNVGNAVNYEAEVYF